MNIKYQKNILKMSYILSMFFFLINCTIAQTTAQAQEQCYREVTTNISIDITQSEGKINTICKIFNSINLDTKKIIYKTNLEKYKGNYFPSLEEIIKNITDANRLINIIVTQNYSAEKKPQIDILVDNLTALLNKSISNFYDAQDSFYRSKQNLAQMGSFLIGSVGYIKTIGADGYLSVDKNRLPLRLKIIKPENPNNIQDDIINNYCAEGQAVSFVYDLDYTSFFNQDQKLLINTDSILSVLTKKGFHPNNNSIFCIVRQGDGYRISTVNDWFLNETATEMTRNNDNAGSFIFVSELNVDQILNIPTLNNFKVQSHGYLMIKPTSHQQSKSNKYLNFKPSLYSPATNNIKFKIIEPLLDKTEEQRVCDPTLLLSFEVVNDSNNALDKVLSIGNNGLLLANKDNLIGRTNKRKASFCLEKKGDFFRLKTLFGSYISNTEINGLTAMESEAAEFDFTAHLITDEKIQQGDVGTFRLYDEGYIKAVTNDPKEFKYIGLQHDIAGVKKIEHIKVRIIPPLLKDTKDFCTASDIAVSFEFAHNVDFVLSRDWWYFKKSPKYSRGIEPKATFCIEANNGHYNIQTKGAYFVDNTGLGFTQDSSSYGDFKLVANLMDQDVNDYDQIGPFTDQSVGYVKSFNKDTYLTVKDINNLNQYLPKVKIIRLDEKIDDYCPDSEQVKFVNTANFDVLANYYGNLYFINHNIALPAEMTTFCLRRVDHSYVIFSAFSKTSNLYVTQNGNSLSADVTIAERFTLANTLPRELLVNSYHQGEVGVFKINAIGYLKMVGQNIYVNAKQHRDVFNNKEDLALKFKLLSPARNESTSWCHNSMAIIFQDNYNPERVLSFNKTTSELTFISIRDEANYRSTVFCLDETENKVGAKLQAFNGQYIDNLNANGLTSNPGEQGRFILVSNLLDFGVGSVSLMNKAAGKSFKSGFRSLTPTYLKLDSQNKLITTPDAAEAEGFIVVPGLADPYCLSLKDIYNNKYIAYYGNYFIKSDFINNEKFIRDATFCPVLDPFEQTIALHLYTDEQEYLTLKNNILTTASVNQVPKDSNSIFVLANKREFIQERQRVQQPITNIDCLNLAPLGKVVDRNELRLTINCPTLKVLRNTMKNDIEAMEDEGRCCTSKAFRYATGTYSQTGNTQCLVKYNLICVNNDPISLGKQSNGFLFN